MLAADAAGGLCAPSLADIPSPSRRREVRVAREVAAPTLLGSETDSPTKGSLLRGMEASILRGGGTGCGGGDCGGGPEAGAGPPRSFKDGELDLLPGALLRSLASEPYETVFADPPTSARDGRLPVLNLNTGETRFLCADGDLARSFVGEQANPKKLKATPWRGWWKEKDAKDARLLLAATVGDAAGAREALAPSADGGPPASIHAHGADGRTALHVAASLGHEDLVRTLLDAQANVDASTDAGCTALHLATTRGHAGVVELLLAAGADVLRATSEGNLALHLAAMSGHIAAATALLELGDSGGLHQLRLRNHSGQLPAEAVADLPMARFFKEREERLGIFEADSYACRQAALGPEGPLLRSSRADAVRRLLLRTKHLATTFKGGALAMTVGEALSASSTHGGPLVPRAGGAGAAAGSQTAGQRTPGSSPAASSSASASSTPRVRGPFVQMRSGSQPVERVGPSSFELVRLLGRGAFGEVFQVKHKRTEEVYAMKVLQKSKIIGKNLQRYAMTERNILAYVRHPYIVSLHYAFQTASHLVLVLQFCPNGNLQHLIGREKRLQAPIAQLYTAEILLALCHLHERKTVFRDLKPDNVVIDEVGHAMLTDFGLSKEGVGAHGTRSFCGSVAFLAPEILLRREHGHTVDVYNLGVLLFAMLTGLPPFYHHDRETLFANIRHQRLAVPRYVPQAAKALIESLMEREPSRRLGAAKTVDVQSHPYFVGIDFAALMRREVPVPGLRIVAELPREVALGPASPMRSTAPPSPFGPKDCALPRGPPRWQSGSSRASSGAIAGWEFAAVPRAALPGAAAAGGGTSAGSTSAAGFVSPGGTPARNPPLRFSGFRSRRRHEGEGT